MPVGYSCVCVDGTAKKVYGDQCKQMFSLHFKRSLCCWRRNAPTGLAQGGSKANETAIAQTHPADP